MFQTARIFVKDAAIYASFVYIAHMIITMIPENEIK